MWIDAIGTAPARGGTGRGGRGATPRPEHLMALNAPFTGEAKELYKSETGIPGITFFENGHLALLGNGGGRGGRGGGGGGGGAAGANRVSRTLMIDLDNPARRRANSGATTPATGTPIPAPPWKRPWPEASARSCMDGDNIFLQGTGPTPTGDHPFLNRFNLTTLKTEKLFRCDDEHYEVVEGLLDIHGDNFLTRRESPTEPPNYFIRTAAGKMTALTNFPDPQPIMRKVKKELVTYKRPDGVEMSFTLYLPPDYKPGTRLPTIIWAYPREYEDAAAAERWP